jgi:hypothetical protein
VREFHLMVRGPCVAQRFSGGLNYRYCRCRGNRSESGRNSARTEQCQGDVGFKSGRLCCWPLFFRTPLCFPYNSSVVDSVVLTFGGGDLCEYWCGLRPPEADQFDQYDGPLVPRA